MHINGAGLDQPIHISFQRAVGMFQFLIVWKQFINQLFGT